MKSSENPPLSRVHPPPTVSVSLVRNGSNTGRPGSPKAGSPNPPPSTSHPSNLKGPGSHKQSQGPSPGSCPESPKTLTTTETKTPISSEPKTPTSTSDKAVKPPTPSTAGETTPANGISPEEAIAKLIVLPRGGYLLYGTPIGPIQFGIPPETIKDSMRLTGAKVPTNYVIYGPDSMFSRQLGLSKAEFEFPAYFNYFVLGKAVNLITTPEIEHRMRLVFQETLIGPTEIDAADDHEEGAPKEDLAQIYEEGQFLDRDRPKTTVDKLLHFTHFDSRAVAKITGEDGSEVEIRVVYEQRKFNRGRRPGEIDIASGCKDPTEFEVLVAGKKIASIPAYWEPASNYRVSKGVHKEKRSHMMSSFHPARALNNHPTNGAYRSDAPIFAPPMFGVTMLGSSHGFDPNGTTTGFVLWMNGRGMMVDPPPESSQVLDQMGVPPLVLDGIILTHCHADHDAGTFQKILSTKRMEIYTTQTIFDSFLRKYSAISGFSVDFIRGLCTFRRVRVGEFIKAHGGALRFFFSLHVIPCVGFEAHYGGKSMTYSADTMTNPELIDKMFSHGVVGKKRAQQLKSFPSAAHSLILHEAGVPPIHTPLQILQNMDAELKRRLWLVHVADHTVPSDSGLKVAHEGDTIVIEDINPPGCTEAMEVLSLVRNCEAFAGLTGYMDCYDILQLCDRKIFMQGETIVKGGTANNGCYLVARGTAIESGTHPPRYFQVGELLGETAFVDEHPPVHDIVAETQVMVLFMDKPLFLRTNAGKTVAADLRRLVAARKAGMPAYIERNKDLAKLTRPQRTQLEQVLRTEKFPVGSQVWRAGEVIPQGLLVCEGSLLLSIPEQDPTVLEKGMFAADVSAVYLGIPTQASLVALTDVMALTVDRLELTKFLGNNPGFLVSHLDTFYFR